MKKIMYTTTILFLLVFLLSVNSAYAWYYSDLPYRMPIEVNTTNNLTDYQLKLNLSNLDSNFNYTQACEGKIRFTDSSDSVELPFWIEECNVATSNLIVWVKGNWFNTNGTQAYLYYGNDNVSDSSSGDSVFDFFDDFVTKHSIKSYIVNKSLVTNNGIGGDANGFSLNTHQGRKSIWTFNNTQYVVFVNSSSYVMVAKRTLPNGSWQIYNTGYTCDTDDPAHKWPTIGISPDGYIHIMYNMHNSNVNYIISDNPEDPSSFSPSTLPDAPTSATYPRFFGNNNSFYFACRDGVTNDGNVVLWKWNTSTKSFETLHNPLIEGKSIDKYAYIDNFAIGPNGTIHISWIWSSYTTGREKLCYAYSDDGGITWKKSDGTPYTLPITYNQSEVIDDTIGDDTWVQNDISVDGNGHPHIVFYQDSQNGHKNYFHIYFNGTQWIKHQITNYTTTPSGSDYALSVSRPGIIINRETNTVYVFGRIENTDYVRVYISQPPYDTWEEATIGSDKYWMGERNQYYDIQAFINTGKLYFLVQDTQPDLAPSSIYVLETDFANFQYINFFDSILNTTKWTISSGSIDVYDGIAHIDTNPSTDDAYTANYIVNEWDKYIIETKAKADNTGAKFFYVEIINSTTTGSPNEGNVGIFNYDGYLKIQNYDGSSDSTITLTQTPDTSWHIWKVYYLSSGNKFYRDNELLGTISTNNYERWNRLRMNAWVYSGQIDWYRVRKYTDPEPTYQISSEETYTSPSSEDNPPSISIASPGNGNYLNSRTVDFVFTPTDDFGFSNCSLWTNESGSFALTQINQSAIVNNTLNTITYTFASDGTYIFNIQCCDNALQCSFNPYGNYTITIDTEPPNVTIQSPGNITYSVSSVDLNYTVSDITPVTCWYSLDEGANTTLTNCNNVTLSGLSDGNHHLIVYAKDSDGVGYTGRTSMDEVYFSVDTQGPVITITHPTSTTYYYDNHDIKLKATDNFKKTFNLDVYLDGSSIYSNSNYENNTVITIQKTVSYGSHNLTVYANDGNFETSETVIFDIGKYVVEDVTIPSQIYETKPYNYSITVRVNNDEVNLMNAWLIWNGIVYDSNSYYSFTDTDTSNTDNGVLVTITKEFSSRLVESNDTAVNVNWLLVFDYGNETTTNHTQYVLWSLYPINLTTNKTTYIEGETINLYGVVKDETNGQYSATIIPTIEFNGTNETAVYSFGSFEKWFIRAEVAETNNDELNTSYTSKFWLLLNYTDPKTGTQTITRPYNENLTITVYKVAMDDCSVFTTKAITFYLKDENNGSSFVGNLDINFYIWNTEESIRNYSFNFTNSSSYDICIYPSWAVYYVDSNAVYYSDVYSQRTYYLYNATLSNQTVDIDLYSLPKTQSSKLLVYVKDNTGVAVNDAYVKIQRYYTSTNTYKTVTILKTDFEGKSLTYVVLNDVYYKFIVEKNGEVLKVTEPMIIPDTVNDPETLTITIGGDVPEFYETGSISHSCSYSNGIINCTVTDTSGNTNNVCLNVKKVGIVSEKDVCKVCEDSSSTTIACNVSNEGNGTFKYNLVSETDYYKMLLESGSVETGSQTTAFGETGIFMTSMLTAFAGALSVFSPAGAIVGTALSLSFAKATNLINITTGAIIGLLVIGIIIFMKVRR